MKRKILSIMVVACLVLTTLPFAAFAQDAEQNENIADGTTVSNISENSGNNEIEQTPGLIPNEGAKLEIKKDNGGIIPDGNVVDKTASDTTPLLKILTSDEKASLTKDGDTATGTCKVSVLIKSYIYTGEEIKPVIIVTYDNKIVSSSDYHIVYEGDVSCVNAGTVNFKVESTEKVGNQPTFTGAGSYTIEKRPLVAIIDPVIKKLPSSASDENWVTFTFRLVGAVEKDKDAITADSNRRMKFSIHRNGEGFMPDIAPDSDGNWSIKCKDSSPFSPGIYQLLCYREGKAPDYMKNYTAFYSHGVFIVLS